MNSLWDIRIFLGLVPKESPCTTHTIWACSYVNLPLCRSGIANSRRAGRTRNHVERVDKVKSFPFCKICKPTLGFIHWMKRIISPGLKRPGSETDRSSPTSAKVNYAWDHTASVPYVFLGRNTLWLPRLSSAVQWGSSSRTTLYLFLTCGQSSVRARGFFCGHATPLWTQYREFSVMDGSGEYWLWCILCISWTLLFNLRPGFSITRHSAHCQILTSLLHS